MQTALTRPEVNDLIEQAEKITDSYTFQTRSWVHWMRETGQGITDDGIKAYFLWLNSESGYAARTIRTKRAAVKKRVRQLFRTADVATRIRIEGILRDLDHPLELHNDAPERTAAPSLADDSPGAEKILTPEEYLNLLHKTGRDRDRLLIAFLWSTGARISEALSIQYSMCRRSGSTVQIRVVGKRQKERLLRAPSQLFDEIVKIFGGKKYLFWNGREGEERSYTREHATRIVARAGRRIGRRISAHALRHCWFTLLIEAHPSKLSEISRLGGHSDTAITNKYYNHPVIRDSELSDVMFQPYAEAIIGEATA